MNMRKKPDTRAFSAPKDPSAFLDGAAEVSNPRVATPTPSRAGQPKLTKIFNLSPELVQALKREAFERSTTEGRRVTETELVDAALRAYLHL
jgi:hypothetical protein